MLQIYNKYNPNANPANTDYPNGSGKDESVEGANDGTPLEMDWYNDELGFGESLLAQGRLTPSGNADTALVSDRLDGLRLAALRVQTACDYTGGDLSLVDVIHVGLDIATVEYVIDRNTLTRWSVGAATGTVTADDLNTGTGALSGVSGALVNINAETFKVDTFQSTGQVISQGGFVTVAHTLTDESGAAVVPFHVDAFIVCTTAENGFSIGDRQKANLQSSDAGTTRVSTIYYDDTNVSIRYPNTTEAFLSGNKADGNGVVLTNANWELYLTAWY